MGCPRCFFSGKLPQGVCPQCGYQAPQQNIPSTSFTSPKQSILPPESLMLPLSSGDTLHEKRYRLIELLPLPWGQQEQGNAYIAYDARFPLKTVLIRQIAFPKQASDPQKIVQAATQRLTELAQHPGFPPIVDTFQERGKYYIVQLYPEGDSLATLLQRQGGALPEREVAEYGLQLCAMLTVLAQYHPPLVHGSISPETIIIDTENYQVSLLHFPLFPLQAPTKEKASTGYLAPEQTRGEYFPSSDLYSLAATLHHAVTGYGPHERLAFFYPPARRLNPVVTSQMAAILAHALRLSAPQRFTHPSEMQQELSALISSYRSPSTASPSSAIPLQFNKEQIRQQSYQKSRRSIGVVSATSIIILLLFLAASLFPFLRNNFSSATNSTAQQKLYQKALDKELNLELQTYRTKGGIGLSDGRLVFDIYPGRTQTDIDLKMKAAQALQQGNTSSAINLLTQATTADPADGEAQIYNENLHILQSRAPSIAIVLGLAVDKSPTHLIRARAVMESAFLAQHEINTKGLLPHGLHLRFLIDNSGEDNANVATVAQFVANRAIGAGNLDHIIAVVGWPSSTETTNARDIIAGIPLPMVSQTASSVKLSGSSPYFFRVNPPDDLQGTTLGSVAIQQLQAKTVLVVQDIKDPYSVSLANAFSTYLKANHITVIDDTTNFTEGTTTVAQYEQTTIPHAITNQVDLIFLAGFDTDGIRLAHALGETSRANPFSTFLTNLKILGGDALGTNLLLGQGNSPDAALATNFPQDMQRLIFTGFSHPDEWTFLKVPQNQQPTLFVNWSNSYQNVPPPAENAPPPENHAILTYDAVQIIAKAATLTPTSLTGQALRHALASFGHGTIPAFQGVSGRISFNDQGNPIDKAVVVLDIEGNNGQNMIVLKQIAGKFF